MLTLALETSARIAGVAVLRDEALLASGATGEQQRTAAALAPLVRDAVSQAGIELGDIDLIAVTVGPGSFTGLRVGVTMAKTLAYCLKCEVLGIDTLEVVAHQMPENITSLWTVLDAQRQQLYAAQFQREADGSWRTAQPTQIADADEWIALLTPQTHVAGPGLQKLVGRLPEEIPVIPEEFWQPQAQAVGRLALTQYAVGSRDDLWRLAPLYFRLSAAEEKAAGM